MSPLRVPASANTVPHYKFLDGLRAVLALYVVAHHALLTVYPDGKFPNPAWAALAYGHFAVCFFIILSGFCLMLPLLKKEQRLARGSADFFKRRAWRILPPYYLALLFSLLLIYFFIPHKTGTHWDISLPVTPHHIVTHFLLIQNFYSEDLLKINHAFWSIAVEWQVYFFFPVLLLSWRRLGPLSTTLFAILGSLSMEKDFNRYFSILPNAHFIGLFALGMLAATISFASPARLIYRAVPWRLVALAAFLGFAALESLANVYTRFQHLSAHLAADLLFGFFGASTLIVASLHPRGWLHRMLGFKPLVFIGTFSYSLYLIHAPILQILWQYPLAPLQPHPEMMCLALIVVGTPLIVLTSYLFFLGCERPFLHRKPKVSASQIL